MSQGDFVTANSTKMNVIFRELVLQEARANKQG